MLRDRWVVEDANRDIGFVETDNGSVSQEEEEDVLTTVVPLRNSNHGNTRSSRVDHRTELN
jgi:hypothetical protein